MEPSREIDLDLHLPTSVTEERARQRQWLAMYAYLERLIASGEPWVTRAAVAPQQWRVLIAEVLTNTTRDENNRAMPADMPLTIIPSVRLATVDGKPLARAKRSATGAVIPFERDPEAHLRGVKIAQHALPAKEQKRWAMQGREIEIYKEYPADFEVTAHEAYRLLRGYGYRCSYPTYHARGTGRQRLRTPLFEVGGPYHDEVVASFGWRDSRVKGK